MSQRKEKEKKRRRRRKKNRAGQQRRPRTDAIDLRVPQPELAHAPVWLDRSGARVEAAHETLGLSASPSPEAVQAAFRASLAETSPEDDPERARRLMQARNVLTEPSEVLTRALGDLRVPNAAHFVPNHVPRTVNSTEPAAAPTERPEWSSRSRLIVLLTLYALLENELDFQPSTPRRDGLFD